MWDDVSLAANHLNEILSSDENNLLVTTNTERFFIHSEIPNEWTENHWKGADQPNQIASLETGWLPLMTNTPILNEEFDQKPDVNFGEIPTKLEVDESDFMKIDIEEMQLEWPQDFKPLTFQDSNVGNYESSWVPVQETQRESPLPSLSDFATTGILANLPPVSPPPVVEPIFLIKNQMNPFPHLEQQTPVCHPSNKALLPIYSRNSQQCQVLPDISANDIGFLLPSNENTDQVNGEIPENDIVMEEEPFSEISWCHCSDDEDGKKCEEQIDELFTRYQKGGINTDDDFIYCELCNKRRPPHCPLHGELEHIQDTPVPMGTEGRARKTAPSFLSIFTSIIKGARKGVWTYKTIPKRVYFGPYEGCKVPVDHSNGNYCWKVTKKEEAEFLIDGSDSTLSNWMRYVNCARTAEEQNLEAFQLTGKIYYRTIKEIGANEELLVWYGFKYAQKLGIKWKDFVESNLPNKKGVAFPCDTCFLSYANPILLEQHKNRHKRCRESSREDSSESNDEKKTPPSIVKEESLICMEVSTGDKPITCGVCGARFKRRGNGLVDHMIQHDHDHACCIKCGEWFPDSSFLDRHLESGCGNRKEVAKLRVPTQCEAEGHNTTITSPEDLLPVQDTRDLSETTELRAMRKAITKNKVDKVKSISSTSSVQPRTNVPRLSDEINAITDGFLPDKRILPETKELRAMRKANTKSKVDKVKSISSTSSEQNKDISRPGEGENAMVPSPKLSLCDKCGSLFYRPCLLLAHLQSKHGIRGTSLSIIRSKEKKMFEKTCRAKRFQCKECGIRYREKSTLESHMKTHEEEMVDSAESDKIEEEMKFSCNKCDLKFRAAITLKYHMECHKEKNTSTLKESNRPKKYKCKKCNMRFKARSTLDLHKTTHGAKRSTQDSKSYPSAESNADKNEPSRVKKSRVSAEQQEGKSSKRVSSNEENLHDRQEKSSVLEKTPNDGCSIQENRKLDEKRENRERDDKRESQKPDEKRKKASKRGSCDSIEDIPKNTRRISFLECLACGFIFKDRASLDIHVRKHTNEKVLVCDLSRVKIPQLGS